MLEDNGLIDERTSKQVYSVDDKRFLPDRYVEGTCPNCGYEKARGDQCDNCGTLLDPVELINPYSSVSGSRNVEIRDTRHLYLLQIETAGRGPRLRRRARRRTGRSLTTSIAYKWLDEGLIDRSITRDLSWGVPVTRNGAPRPGFENKVFYVWFDAPDRIHRLDRRMGRSQRRQDWERWWRTDKGASDVTYVEFMGKDNVAFHTVSLPRHHPRLEGAVEARRQAEGLQLAQLVWRQVLDQPEARRLHGQGAGASARRLLALVSHRQRARELRHRLHLGAASRRRMNSDLNDVLGNFVNRITKYAAAKFDGKVPEGGEPGEHEAWMANELATRLPALIGHYEAMEFRKAAAETRAIWAAGNEYITKAAPWTAYKTSVDQAAVGIRTGLNLVALFGIIAQPIIPETAKKILDALGVPEGNRSLALAKLGAGGYAALLDALPRGMTIAVPPQLFTKIEDAQVADWTARFGGG